VAESVPDAWKEAQDAVEDLREALREQGIILPSLGVDMIGIMSDFSLVNLGSATAETAHRLAAALRGGGES
jgi:hypothetical protein